MSGLYCETTGTGTPVVLVHGWGTHGGIWESMCDVLSSGHSLCIPDLPGHGRSQQVEAPTLGAMVDTLETVAPREAVWIGWSLGALASIATALRAPQRVKALVLIAATPRFVQAPDWSGAMPETTLAEFARDLQHDYRATLSRFLALQLGQGEAERSMLRQLRASLFAHGEPSPKGLAAGLEILRDSDLRTQLQTIDVPVLMVHGARDRIAPVVAAEIAATQLPQAELLVIPGAGHAPQFSHWSTIEPTLTRFLATHG